MPKQPNTFIEEQYAAHQSALATMRRDGRFTAALCDQLEQLSNKMYEVALYQFAYGEPDQFQKCSDSMTTFIEMLSEILDQANSKK
jgi:hypothetical protein